MECIDKCEKEINGDKIFFYYNEDNQCLDSCSKQTGENKLLFL